MYSASEPTNSCESSGPFDPGDMTTRVDVLRGCSEVLRSGAGIGVEGEQILRQYDYASNLYKSWNAGS